MLWLTWSRLRLAGVCQQRGGGCRCLITPWEQPLSPLLVLSPSAAIPTVTAALPGVSPLLIWLLSAVTRSGDISLHMQFLSPLWFDGVLFLSPLPSSVLSRLFFSLPFHQLCLNPGDFLLSPHFIPLQSLKARLRLLFCSQWDAGVAAVSCGSCQLI